MSQDLKYIGAYTVAFLFGKVYWLMHYSRTVFILEYTSISHYIIIYPCIYQYIRVKYCIYWQIPFHTRTCGYRSVYARTKHYAKLCIIQGFEPWTSCTLQGCIDHCTTSVDTSISFYMMENCGLPAAWCRKSCAGPAVLPAQTMT
jgi:hypothetical protein